MRTAHWVILYAIPLNGILVERGQTLLGLNVRECLDFGNSKMTDPDLVRSWGRVDKKLREGTTGLTHKEVRALMPERLRNMKPPEWWSPAGSVDG